MHYCPRESHNKLAHIESTLRGLSGTSAGSGLAAAYHIVLTFFLLTTFTLVADLHGAHGQNDGDYEKQYAAHHAGRDRFVLDPRRHRELHLFRTLVASLRIGQHSEVVRTSTN